MFKELSSNLGLKVTALVLALLIWLYVYQSQGPEVPRVFFVNVTARNLTTTPDEYIITSMSQATVTVTLVGSKVLMDEIKETNVTAYVDLLGKEAGVHQVDVQVNAPSSINRVSVNPNKLTVTLEKATRKNLPIEFNYEGQAPYGLTKGETTIEPQEMPVAGPESIVSKLSKVRVTINLDTLKEGENKLKLPYKLYDNGDEELSEDDLAKMRLNFQTVSVEIQGKTREQINIVPIVPRFTGNLPPDRYNMATEWVPKSVTISGSYDVIQKIKQIYTEPFSLNGLVTTTEETLTLEVPKGVVLVDTKNTKLTIRIEPIATKRLMIPIDVIPKNSNYKLDNDRIWVEFKGPSSSISGLFTASLTIDITGKPPGDYVLEVKVSGIPDGVYITQTPKVKVKVF